jgi:hypothetical protein
MLGPVLGKPSRPKLPVSLGLFGSLRLLAAMPVNDQ